MLRLTSLFAWVVLLAITGGSLLLRVRLFDGKLRKPAVSYRRILPYSPMTDATLAASTQSFKQRPGTLHTPMETPEYEREGDVPT